MLFCAMHAFGHLPENVGTYSAIEVDTDYPGKADATATVARPQPPSPGYSSVSGIVLPQLVSLCR